jgi:hypothetical protein
MQEREDRMKTMDRRGFLGSVAAAGAFASLGPVAAAAGQAAQAGAAGTEGRRQQRRPWKAVYISMLPKELGYLERFQLAKEVGFEGIEIGTISEPAVAQEILEASKKPGCRSTA